MGLLTPCFVPGEGFLYTIIVPGGGFLLPSSRVPGVCPGGGWFWMKLIPALRDNVWHQNKQTKKGASNCMILEHVTTCTFLQNRSAKYQRSVKNFTEMFLVIS